MEKDYGLDKERIWGLEKTYDLGRIIPIYEAIKDLEITDAVDVACGVGLIAEGLSWVKGNWEQFDIKEYPEWEQLRIKPEVKDVRDFIKTNKKYDLVMFLNSYRNWEGKDKEDFDNWVKEHTRYFITSDAKLDGGRTIGKDVKNFNLEIYEF